MKALKFLLEKCPEKSEKNFKKKFSKDKKLFLGSQHEYKGLKNESSPKGLPVTYDHIIMQSWRTSVCSRKLSLTTARSFNGCGKEGRHFELRRSEGSDLEQRERGTWPEGPHSPTFLVSASQYQLLNNTVFSTLKQNSAFQKQLYSKIQKCILHF